MGLRTRPWTEEIAVGNEHASRDNVFYLDPQTVTLQDLGVDGYVLVVGGGGEGVIGQLQGDRVVAIDRRRAEMEEAPPGGLKIVMDATETRADKRTQGHAALAT
jgi:hypothetical protein